MYSLRQLAGLAAAVLVAFPAAAANDEQQPEPPKVKWIEGPKKVELGSVAELNLPDSVVFAGKADTQKLLERMGNVPNGTELGMVVPKAEDQDWFIVFDYDDIGYIKDADKAEIDGDAILKSIQEGTEEGNKERKKRGYTALHVTGWAEAPHYDARTHNLTWAALHKTDEGEVGLNYNVRLLGRSGVMSVTLVEDPGKLAAAKPSVDAVIGAFAFKQGKTYAEWRKGDKVAEYGLAALVTAGAGAAAVKLGFFGVLAKLFAKMGKALVLVVAAIGGAIAKLWRSVKAKISGRNVPAENRSSGPGIGGGPGAQGGLGG